MPLLFSRLELPPSRLSFSFKAHDSSSYTWFEMDALTPALLFENKFSSSRFYFLLFFSFLLPFLLPFEDYHILMLYHPSSASSRRYFLHPERVMFGSRNPPLFRSFEVWSRFLGSRMDGLFTFSVASFLFVNSFDCQFLHCCVFISVSEKSVYQA